MKENGKLTNQEILSLLKENKETSSNKAFEAIYVQSFPMLKKLIMQKGGNAADAYDIFQDVMLVFFNHVKTNKFKGESAISTYLYSIGRNLWYQYLQKNDRYQFQSEIPEESLVEVTVGDLDKVQSTEIVSKLLKQLDKNCEKLLMMFYYSRKSMKDIMGFFGLSSQQVAKTKKMRCMKKLSTLIDQMKIDKDLINY